MKSFRNFSNFFLLDFTKQATALRRRKRKKNSFKYIFIYDFFLPFVCLRFMKCFASSLFADISFLCLSRMRGERKKRKLPSRYFTHFTQFNKNVILKLKSCGWNNKLNKSRFHFTPFPRHIKPTGRNGKALLGSIVIGFGSGKMHTRKKKRFRSSFAWNFCVIGKRFKDVYPLLLSLKKPLKKKYAVESEKNVFTMSYGDSIAP